MDKADIAIGIAILSAAFSAWQAYSSHVTARIAKTSLRRKPLVIETSLGSDASAPKGWRVASVAVRNLEPVSAIVVNAKAKPKTGRLVSQDEARDDYDTAYGNFKMKDVLPDTRETPIRRTISPFGTPQSRSGVRPGDTVHITLYAKNISKPSDIAIEWVWTDGTKP